MSKIKADLDDYKAQFVLNDRTAILVIIAQILLEISSHLEGLENKAWE